MSHGIILLKQKRPNGVRDHQAALAKPFEAWARLQHMYDVETFLNYTPVAVYWLRLYMEGANFYMGYYIFVAWITTKDGQKIYARDYGKKLLNFGLIKNSAF